MSWLFARPVLLMASLIYLCFFVLAHFIPHKPFIEALRVIAVSMGIACAFAYGWLAWKVVFAKQNPDIIEQLSLGVSLSFITITLHGIWTIIWRFAGQPAWMQNSDVTALFVMNFILAASLHLLPPGSIDRRIPRRNKLIAGLAVAVGVVLALIFGFMHPDLEPFAEMIRPWIEEPDGGSYYHSMP